MTRFIMPIILIVISVALFFTVTNPMYSSIADSQAQLTSYNTALDTSKTLESQRDALTAKYNSFDPNNLAKLEKLLPDNVNNIRLILEIEQIASPYGMALSDVKYDSTNSTSVTTGTTGGAAAVQGGSPAKKQSSDYGIFNLEFSITGTYDNFINFTKDLQSNLRIVDISSISFSSDTTSATSGTGSKTNAPETYKYDFKIQTYWLKS